MVITAAPATRWAPNVCWYAMKKDKDAMCIDAFFSRQWGRAMFLFFVIYKGLVICVHAQEPAKILHLRGPPTPAFTKPVLHKWPCSAMFNTLFQPKKFMKCLSRLSAKAGWGKKAHTSSCRSNLALSLKQYTISVQLIQNSPVVEDDCAVFWLQCYLELDFRWPCSGQLLKHSWMLLLWRIQ